MRFTALVILFVFTLIARAETLAEQIDALLAAKQPDANIGIVVQRLDTGERIVARNDTQLFTPASLTKSLTTYVAFKTLDFDFRFNTELLSDNNNIYIRFVGDPSLTSEDLNLLLSSIKSKKINNIIIDDTVFEKPYYSRGWTYDSLNWYYAAPISSVILDENKIDAVLQPADTLRAPATITLDEKAQDIVLNTQVYTATEQEAETTCQLNILVSPENIVDIYGCWPISPKPKKLGIGLSNPNLYVKNTIQRYLNANNIKISGEILTGETPSHAKPIAVHQSEMLVELAKPILRDSKNFYTEPFTKTLGNKLYNQGTFQAGSYAVQQQLFELLEIDPNEVVLYDGSGGDSYNLITPNAAAKVLSAAFHDKSIQPAYRNAEAKPGEKGTLKRRMKNLPKEANFSGKTGTGNNASALGGTMIHPANIPLVVVIMSNGNPQKYRNIKQIEDEIVELIYSAPVAQLDSASPS